MIGVEEEKEITDVHFGEISMSAIYQGVVLLWEAVRSCFGRGRWVNEKPWLNDDAWRNE